MQSKKIEDAIKTIQLFVYDIDCPVEFLKAIETLIDYVEINGVKA